MDIISHSGMILRSLINKTSKIRIPNFSISFFSKRVQWYIEHYSTEATINGRGGHLGYVPRTNFRSPYRDSTQNLALNGQSVSEKNMFEIVDNGRTVDRWVDIGAWVSYKLTFEPSTQVS